MLARDRQQARTVPPPPRRPRPDATSVSALVAPAVRTGRTELNPAAVRYLQRAAGNQAVSSLLGRQWPLPIVQRDIENETFRDGISEADTANAKDFFTAFNAAVKLAHKYVISVPSLGAWVDLDGYTQLWGEKWADFLSGRRPKLMAATFGYVIESLVSGDTDFRPTAPADCTVVPQVTSGGTRPDLVLRLKKGGADIAWLDLTASESVNHIFAKEGWNQKIGSFAEVTYPSLDPGTLAFMVQNKDNTGTLSKEEFDKRQKAAQEAYRERKRHWVAMGKEQYSVGVHKKALRRIGRMKIEVNPGLKRSFIKVKLEAGFQTKIDDEKLVPSILKAMGVSPASWQFTTGYSESERAGEAWLVDNDPTLPSPSPPQAPVAVGGEDGRPSAGGLAKTERADVRAKPY